MASFLHFTRTGTCVTVTAAVLAIGASSALAQQSAPPPAAPTPMPPPPMILPPPGPNDEMRRRWEFDAQRMIGGQAELTERYRHTVTFAECAQRVSPTRVASLLEKPLDSAEERRAANSLIRFAPGCLGSSIMVSTRLLRGAAAEAVLEGYRSGDPDTVKEISSTRMENFLEATPGTGGERDKTALALTRMTQCQVMFAPGLSRKLLNTKPESKDEGEARTRLVEGTAMCGQIDATSDHAWLVHRSYLAEALYHWTRSAGGFSRS